MNKNSFLPWGIALALAVRLAYLILTVHTLHIPVPHTGDDYHYYMMGIEVKEQGLLFTDTSSYPQGRDLNFTAPLIGWYLGLIFTLFGVNWLAVIVCNLMISILLVYIIYRIVLLLSSDYRYGNIALLISAFYCPFLYYFNSAGKEILIAFMLMLTVYLVLLLEQARRGYIVSAAAALAFSLLCHLDERYLFYFPLFAIFVYFIGRQTEEKRAIVIGYVLIFIFFVALFFTPWIYRNNIVFKKPVLLSSRMMPFTDKLLGNSDVSLRGLSGLSNRSEEYEFLSTEQLDSITTLGVNVHRKTPITADEYNYIKTIRKPFHYNKKQQYLSHAKDLWRITNLKGDFIGTGYRFNKWSPKRNLMSLLTYGVVLLVAILTFAGFYREYKTTAVFFLCIFILHTIIHVFILGLGLTRYRYPIDGLLIVIAATGLGYAFLSKLGDKKRY
jgi:hypothetical protein